MKITISKSEFLMRMGIGTQFSGKNKVMPILDCVKIDIKNGKMSFTSTDGNNTIKTYTENMQCDTDETAFCVSAKDVLSYTKAINDTMIEFISSDNNFLTIKHSKGKATFPMSDSSEYPKVELEKDVIVFNTDSETLYNWISMVRSFVCTDELRPQMGGCYLYAKDGEYGCCATDSMSLFTDNKKIESDVDFGVVLNRNSFSSIMSLLNRNEDVTLRIGSKNVVLICGDSKLIVRLIEGRFPNFKGILPKSQPISINVDLKDILESIQRVSLAGNKVSGLIKLSIDGMNMNITAQDIDYSTSASENICCDSNGNIVIGVKDEKLINCINAIATDKICFGMSDPTRAITIKESSNSNKILLLMPMLLND